MKKTNLFLKQCFVILTMGAVLFSISCSESDVDLDVGDGDIVLPDVDDDDDDDDLILPDDSEAIAKFVAYLETYAEYIPTTSVETLEYIDAEFAAAPSEIADIIELHADAVAEAAEGLVVTSVVNDVDTLFITYKNAGVGGFAALYKGGVDVLVSDKTSTSIVTIEVGEYSFSFPKGYANNISGLTCTAGKIAMAPGAKSTINVTIETINDVAANGYINHISGFTIYTDAVSTKSSLEEISPDLLRVVSAEYASSVSLDELTLSIEMSSEANAGWGSVSLQYGVGTKTDEIVLSSIELSEVQSIAYGITTAIAYDPNVIDMSKYYYDPEDASYVNSFNLYFTGVDNSGSVIVNDAVLSADLAIDSYEIRLYEILGSDAEAGNVPVEYANDKNLLLGTSEEKAAILAEITSNVNVVDDNLYLSSLNANALDYVSTKSSDDATIALNLAISSLSPNDTKTKVYLMVVSGTTTNSDDNNCFVVSNVINIKNNAEVYMRVYQETEELHFKAGTLEVPIETNYYWSAECDCEGDEEWITLSSEAGELDYTLVVSYGDNPTYSDRPATLTISAEKENGDPIEYVIDINQIKAEEAYVELSTEEERITYVEGSVDVDVESNVAWTISAKPDWITMVDGGEESASIVIDYDENDTGIDRTGLVAFQYIDPITKETYTEGITLYQAGEVAPAISISEDEMAVGSRGDSFTVDIESNFDWTITCDKDWVTIPVASGNYNKKNVVIDYGVNLYESSDREATITFTAGGDETTLVITQNKAPQYAEVTYSSAAYDFTNLTYTLVTDQTITEMFGADATVDNLATEKNVVFTVSLGNGFQYEDEKDVTYGVDELGHVLMTIPMSLSTYGTFTAESSISYGSETVRMAVDFYANSYPVTFECNLEELVGDNSGKALGDVDSAALACFQYTEVSGLISYDHDRGVLTDELSSGLIPLGFIEPIESDRLYLKNSGSTTKPSSMYCTYVYIADEDPSTGCGGTPSRNTTYNWTYINAKTYLVASGVTLSPAAYTAGLIINKATWTGTSLQYSLTTWSRYLYAGVEYRIYALVTYTTGTKACYDTGFKFKIYYAG